MARGTIACLVAALGLTSAALADHVVLESSFEGNGTGGSMDPTYDETNGTYWSYFASTGHVLNDNGVLWTVGGTGTDRAGVDQIMEPNYSPNPFPDGSFALDLNSYSQGSITTSLTTVIGELYTMTFWLSGNGVTGHVSALPGAVAFQSDPSLWQQFTLTFTATALTTTIGFESTAPGGPGGPTIDLVRITAVPLPAALYAGLGTLVGVGGLGFLRRSRLARV